MGVKWTSEQQKVIELRNRNILVSAAAGSGKTAVLVERIIQMLTSEVNPVNVDRLLIVTFTEAAASEMKERIREAIEEALEISPHNLHLQRQATLIHSAPITTIHSFCLSVIRDHFHVLNIDPGFRIAEEGELKLLRQDVLEDMLEKRYLIGDTAFLDFVEKFGTGRNDKKIEEIITRLYLYSRSYPQPDKWLDECAGNYTKNEEKPAYTEHIEKMVRQKAEDMLFIIDEGMELCNMPDGPYMYVEMLESDKELLLNLQSTNDIEDMYRIVQNISWKRLSAKKDDTVDLEKKDKVKALRDKIKKIIKDINSMYFYEEPQEILKDMIQSSESIGILVELVKEFHQSFSEKKQSKNMIDFSDMEQFALQILTTEVEGKLEPSIVAQEYQDLFAEVMIDEYQDSNLIQEAILTSVSTVCSGKNNVFMVGDVKQSIYRFRLSRPELFMEKYESYSLSDSNSQRIDLHKNFRSREEVLNSVNFIFEQIMIKELGGIRYDEQAALYPGAAYEYQTDAKGNTINQTELLLVDTSQISLENKQPDSEADSNREVEARVVAERIKQLLKNGRVLDKKTGQYRSPQYRDMVILTRSMKGWGDVFSAVLGEEGIPAYAGSREGYFETYEVSVLLDYLRILDNYMQELPLAAVLTSPFVGLNTEQLAVIRNAYPKTPFYEAVREFAAETEHKGIIQELLNGFLLTYNYFRERVPYTSIHELLRCIIEETGYGLYISAMPGGGQRTANLEMLVEKASAFAGTSYKGLFNFVRYIEQLKKYDVDYGEANIADEQSDTVRIMTIHKSKGLEFPIVFVSGMGKRFNTQDTKGSIVIHPEWGVGIDAIDLEKRTKIPTILKKVIQEEITRENLGEELRVLYVALTRAKEKLIMTGELNNASEVIDQYLMQKNEKKQHLPYYLLSGAHCYLDWILPVIGEMTDAALLEVEVKENVHMEAFNVIESKADELARNVLECWDTEVVYNSALHDSIQHQLSYTYPYEQEGKLKLKFTVSELKKRSEPSEDAGELLYNEPEVIPLLPQFLTKEKELTGASRGSAYHKLMELLDFSGEYDEEKLRKEIQRLNAEEKLSREMADCIRIPDILAFLHSKSGRRMCSASRRTLLKKEQPFVLGIDAVEIYPEEKSNEILLVQGIIDVYFEENGELIVLDYKTDQVKTALELKEKYHAQLDYYARALEQLLGKKVKEKIIYSFTLAEEILV